MLAQFLAAKLDSTLDSMQLEGCHGFWEMSINRSNHPDIPLDRLAALLETVSSPNIYVAKMAAAAVWGFATSAPSRRAIAELNGLSILLTNLKRSLKMVVVPDPAFPPLQVKCFLGAA
jgi:hypothetical protein